MITRKSARQAFRGGITASQIIRFLNMHAHPKVGCYLYILSTISGFPLLYLVIHPVLILSILLSSSYPSCSPRFIHPVLLILFILFSSSYPSCLPHLIQPVLLILSILFTSSYPSCSPHFTHPVILIIFILFPSSYPSCFHHLIHPVPIILSILFTSSFPSFYYSGLVSFSRILFSQYF